MLRFFIGTDREKARAALKKAAQKAAREGVEVVRITDANTLSDLRSALAGGGMFGAPPVVVLEGVLANEEMRAALLESLPSLKKRDDTVLLYEEKPDAPAKKAVEKYAESTERFDAAKGRRDEGSIFRLADALKRGDKKALWVGYQRALAREEAPEAIHGVLFWGAKQSLLASSGKERGRAKRLVAELAELPHESRRKGVDLEYALERYILGVNKS